MSLATPLATVVAVALAANSDAAYSLTLFATEQCKTFGATLLQPVKETNSRTFTGLNLIRARLYSARLV